MNSAGKTGPWDDVYLQAPPRRVVVEHHLSVLGGAQLHSSGVVSGVLALGIHIDDLAVTLVFKQQALCAVRDHLQIGSHKKL